jgi:ACR3 family arsenite transporter
MSLAEKYEAAITVIHVIPDLASMGYDLSVHFSIDQIDQINTETQSKAMDSIKERVKSVCEELKDDIPRCRVDLNNVIIKAGHPVQEIIAAVDDGKYDMVVMGTHGHSLISDLLIGSVARGVVHKCKVPVLTIRLAAE